MHFRFSSLWSAVALSVSIGACGQGAAPQEASKSGVAASDNARPLTKVPTGVIFVKGAWSSASDSATPLPEGGKVTHNIFSNQYFGMTYSLPPNWIEKYKGPPPSDSGRYVLAQMSPDDTVKGASQGSVLITAQDMFFAPLPDANVLDLVNYSKDNLQADYKVEMPPKPIKVAGRPFGVFAYWSPVAQLHWYVLATQIRCHTVEFVLTSRDTKLLESMIREMNKMKLPADAGSTTGTGADDVPVCMKDYARDENVITRVDPIFTGHRFNSIPVRIVINKEGKIRHIHLLSAFPDQAIAITDALRQWRFKPYLNNGHRAEVETGIMFGSAASSRTANN